MGVLSWPGSFVNLRNGSAGINYRQRDNIILAPIVLGAGLRAGAGIGTYDTVT
jgi:hypothetical protein